MVSSHLIDYLSSPNSPIIQRTSTIQVISHIHMKLVTKKVEAEKKGVNAVEMLSGFPSQSFIISISRI